MEKIGFFKFLRIFLRIFFSFYENTSPLGIFEEIFEQFLCEHTFEHTFGVITVRGKLVVTIDVSDHDLRLIFVIHVRKSGRAIYFLCGNIFLEEPFLNES